jgi:hypothetical protein
MNKELIRDNLACDFFKRINIILVKIFLLTWFKLNSKLVIYEINMPVCYYDKNYDNSI